MQKHQYNISKIVKKIDKYQYVSFDIFDTLIKRNIQKPSDIFELVQIEYANKYNKKINNYKDIRTRAEIEARTLDKSKEPNIDDIYKCLELNKKEYNIEKLKQIEINLEYKFCQKNDDFYSVYKYCIDNNKKIIITSDMYLKKEQIIKILDKADIKKYDYLFLSNDVKLNKYNGKIYKYILDKLRIKSNQIVHIGDSKRGDYIFPKLYRIQSILIPKKIKKINYDNSKILTRQEKVYYGIVQSFINNNMPYNENSYYKIGFEVLGPLLYGYTKWLIKCLEYQKIQKVFFLAREGNLLKEAFDIINNDNIESKYLYVSRRSTRVSLLKNIKHMEDIFEIINMRRIIDVESFFINVGLDIKLYKNLLKKYNCNSKSNIKDIKEFEKLFEEIKIDIINNAKKEEKNLIGYLEQEKVLGKIAFADIGWVGTMQNAINRILIDNNYSCDISGFYMGQAPEAIKFIEENIKLNSYLFSYKQENEYQKARAFLNLFESFFLAQHGMTVKYELRNDKYEPILDDYEYSIYEKEIFSKIQKGAISFIRKFIKEDLIDINLAPDIVWASFKKLGLHPSLKDTKLFGNISYVETIKCNFAKPKSITYYIIHPKQLYIDFCNCSWKIGFLKKLFKVKLNYYTLYDFLMKYKKDKSSNLHLKNDL